MGKTGNLELNKIYCGDNVELMSQLPDGCIDLAVTSPPYDNVTYNDKGELVTMPNGLRTYNGYSWDFCKAAQQLWRVIKPGGVVVWVVGDATIDGSETGSSFRQALYFMSLGFKLHDTMIYQRINLPQTHNRYEQHFEYMFIVSKGKPQTFNPIFIKTRNAGASKKGPGTMKSASVNERLSKMGNQKQETFIIKETTIKGNVWYYDVAFSHPAIFPDALTRDHILSWSNPHELILDPFAGSGTTCKMAYLTDRNFIGMEISQGYVDLATRRVSDAMLQPKLLPFMPAEKEKPQQTSWL